MKFCGHPSLKLCVNVVRRSPKCDAANRAARDLELAQKPLPQMRESKEQAQEIIENANKRANQIIDEAKEAAKIEGARLVAAAQAEVERSKPRKEALRKQVSELAIAGAVKILGKSVDAAAHNDLLNQLAEELLSEVFMAGTNSLARPYAKAVFAQAQEGKKLDVWSSDLALLAACVAEEKVAEFLQHPALTAAQQAQTLVDVCGDKLNAAAKNLITVLAENKRFDVTARNLRVV